MATLGYRIQPWFPTMECSLEDESLSYNQRNAIRFLLSPHYTHPKYYTLIFMTALTQCGPIVVEKKTKV